MSEDRMNPKEAIATATLLGCEFWPYKYYNDSKVVFHVTSDVNHIHPVEEEFTNKTGYPGSTSKTRLARAYVAWCLDQAKDAA